MPFKQKGEPVSANENASYFAFKPGEVDDIYQFNRNNIISRKDSSCKKNSGIELNHITSKLFAPLK